MVLPGSLPRKTQERLLTIPDFYVALKINEWHATTLQRYLQRGLPKIGEG
jgi:hypothetical protein